MPVDNSDYLDPRLDNEHYHVGDMIAIEDPAGRVYVGLVAAVNATNYDVDILADSVYRSKVTR